MSRKLRSTLSIFLMMSGLLIFFQNCSPPASVLAKVESNVESQTPTDQSVSLTD